MSSVLRILTRRVTVLSLVAATLFVVLASFAAPSRAQQLVASWYGVGDGFAGLTTANGETFDPYAYTAAHKNLPFNTKLEVTYGGESVVVRVNDRGPYVRGRDIDLSYAAARDIGLTAAGSAPVDVEYVDSSAPVGPVQASQSAPVPEPSSKIDTGVEPKSAEDSSPQSAQGDGGLPQYPVEQQVTDGQYASAEQYASADQYEGGQNAATNQYKDEPPVAGESSPANIAPPMGDLEEPPKELVKAGTTVEHRVELNIAAAPPGTATEAPKESKDSEAAPKESKDSEVAQEDAPQEAEIKVLPDTGGPVKLPEVSATNLVGVLLLATVLRIGLRKLQA